jgi:hypothetical protein
MKLDLEAYSYEGKSYPYTMGEETVNLTIRPYAESKAGTVTFTPDGMKVDNWKRFNHCLTAWDMQDMAGNVIPLTDAVKRKVFDFNIKGVATFVLGKVTELEKGKGEALGN